MKLFAILIGGDIKGGNLELHDVRFVAGNVIEDTFDQLRRDWWGRPASLHLDCWTELAEVDGYRVSLASEPGSSPEKLFFVHLGGYDGSFEEKHLNLFIVAADKDEAKKKALKQVSGWTDKHRDALLAVDSALPVEASIAPLYIHLEPTGREPAQPAITCQYRVIGKA